MTRRHIGHIVVVVFFPVVARKCKESRRGAGKTRVVEEGHGCAAAVAGFVHGWFLMHICIGGSATVRLLYIEY